MGKPFIRIVGLKKHFEMGGQIVRALDGVDVQIEEGTFTVVMGPSGSGKSTLLYLLGGLDRPTSGEIAIEDERLDQMDENALALFRRRVMGFVFQSFNLLPRTSVFENVELPLLYARKLPGDAKARVDAALLAVSMEHRAQYFSNQLSGGEKQRVAIARALVNNPDIIFADEPTGNLDSKSGLQVMKILQKLNNEGKTIILVTHETATAEHASRILRMLDGTVVSDEKVVARRNALDATDLIK